MFTRLHLHAFQLQDTTRTFVVLHYVYDYRNIRWQRSNLFFFICFLPSSFVVTISSVAFPPEKRAAEKYRRKLYCSWRALCSWSFTGPSLFSLVMWEAPKRRRCQGDFHRGGCARLSRHALMRLRGYGSGLYKVLINGVYALSLCATRGTVFAVFEGGGISCVRGYENLWKADYLAYPDRRMRITLIASEIS